MKHFIVHGLFCLLIVNVLGCTKYVEIIAHRGASYLAPENTMASVMLGWKKEADVEVDIHLSKDNRILVIHDASTKRTGETDIKVEETTSQELRELGCNLLVVLGVWLDGQQRFEFGGRESRPE